MPYGGSLPLFLTSRCTGGCITVLTPISTTYVGAITSYNKSSPKRVRKEVQSLEVSQSTLSLHPSNGDLDGNVREFPCIHR